MRIIRFLKIMFFLFLVLLGNSIAQTYESEIYIRINQLGYLPNEMKIAITFSKQSSYGKMFVILDENSSNVVYGPIELEKNVGSYGDFPFHHLLDFSDFKKPGRYRIKIKGTKYESRPVTIGDDVYEDVNEQLLAYIRQQRCGYNPFLDEVCHAKDGKTAYGPMPDGTYIDVSGGWHDAGDQLRYMLTSGNTIGRLLFAYRENKGSFKDRFNYLGQSVRNDIPDILDEVKWGLDWMLKMHPAPDQLFHQVADDRDHGGWSLPHKDKSDYGWGEGSYRVVYYANGKPQGLGKFQNTSTGIANLAGRYAAVMAMAADIWKNDLQDSVYANRCLQAGKEVYEMGLKQPGCQEGTPHNAPYRYYEITWADDMEWGAAELFRVTNKKDYLLDAKKFAKMIITTSWMGLDTARHYEYYPFMNLGHYTLFPLVDKAFQDTLAKYYLDGIEKIKRRATDNPYSIGIPFIWCSNNLAAAFVTQCLLYEKMTGDDQYHSLALTHTDWLLGRNPWGASQFVGIPPTGGVTPQFPHSPISDISDRPIIGGLNDGPVYTSIFNSLKGIHLNREDIFAKFQSDLVVYHDDLGDYSTNEPTLDGTAEALFFITYFAKY